MTVVKGRPSDARFRRARKREKSRCLDCVLGPTGSDTATHHRPYALIPWCILYGMPHSLPIIYFHGMPGSPRELNLFGTWATTEDVYAPDRNSRSYSLTSDYLDALAATVRTRHPVGQVRIISFSLGTVPALQVAARLGPLVACIDLVSPAAPWNTGEYPDTAGGAVFKLAKRAPRLFSRLVGLQALAARYAGAGLYSGLFATAQGADRELARQRHFRATMIKVLTDCFANNAIGYRAEILDYVMPWAGVLAQVEQPVTFWHGTADNWAPVEMTAALQIALPNVADVRRFPGLSHYSTLEAVLGARLGWR